MAAVALEWNPSVVQQQRAEVPSKHLRVVAFSSVD
jgi:hypothetical protein